MSSPDVPTNITRIFVAGYFTDSNDVATAGKLVVTPDFTRGINDAWRRIVMAAPTSMEPSASTGLAYVSVVAGDDPDLNPSNFTHTVGEPGGRKYQIFVSQDTPVWTAGTPGHPLDGQRVLWLNSVAPSDAASSGVVQVVAGPQGPPGEVSAAQLSAAVAAAKLADRPDLSTTGAAVGGLVAGTDVSGGAPTGFRMVRRWRPPSVVCLGDSQTAGTLTPGLHYPGVLASLVDRRLAITNKGVGGNTTAQMLARVQADVIDLAPSICLFLGGTNDLAGGVAPSTTHANIAAIATAVNAAGIEFVICTVPPRNQWTHATASVPHVRNLNNWIKVWAKTNGHRVVDLNPVLTKPRDGQWTTGYNADAVHPTAAGIMAMAQAAANVLTAAPTIPQLPSLLPTDGSVDFLAGLGTTYAYDAQLVGNPLMWDLAGDRRPEGWRSTSAAAMSSAASAGATTLQITDPLTPGAYRVSFGQTQAETVTITAVTGSAAPYTATLSAATVNPHPAAHVLDRAESVATIVADPRFVGFAEKVVCTAQTGPWTDAYPLPSGQWAVGDVLRLVHKLAIEGPTSIPSGSGVEVALVFTGPGTSTKSVTQWAYDSPPGTAQTFAIDAAVPAGTTAITAQVSINLGGGTATVYAGQVGVINLTTLGVASLALAA